ncbi:hypothetical protein N7495_009698 [Penicillium taxi]|uniref:uncharacterized protein n=1 Tax=Penicillium taxi TaxID=168475 RepID=UPI0025459DAC|nr:uncharacterized protein N7495_009698 [Penicillium taxi]KAJ5885188.1 hypothetical protein N7495_009698 [Penicillium taxi]
MPGTIRSSHDEFFSSLTGLLTQASKKSRGSVYLSQKPIIDPESTTPLVLIRATDGNTNAPNPKSTSKDDKIVKNKSTKVKFSTVVKTDELDAFYTRYAEVCKAGMTGLKKRDRKKAKGKKATKA